MNIIPLFTAVKLQSMKKPFDDNEWIFEIKYDGFRAMLYVNHGSARLISRYNKRLPFPELEVRLAERVPTSTAVFDGEIVSLDDHGKPIFRNLLKRRGIVVYIAFDILWLKGKDLTNKTLRERKEILRTFAKMQSKTIIRAPFSTDGRGIDLYRSACSLDLEGIVAKPLWSRYGQRTRWYKILNPSYSQRNNRPVFKH